MKKQIYLILLLLMGSATCSAKTKRTIYGPHGMELSDVISLVAQKKSQQKLEFAFDIHKVLVQKTPKAELRTICNSDQTWHVLAAFFNIPFMIGLGSMVWQAIINILPWTQNHYRELTAEELMTITHTYGDERLEDLFVRIINSQIPDPQMIKIVSSLSKEYPLHIASNIGREIYIKLKQQLEEQGNNIFAYFQKDANGLEGKMIDYSVSQTQKPDPTFFQEFLDAYDPDGTKLFIFVDDKLVNIKAATQLGFVGIHFKNAKRLKKDLKKLGIAI